MSDDKNMINGAADDLAKDENNADSSLIAEGASADNIKIEELEKEIAELKAKQELSQDKLLRAVAEGENIRRRAEKNIEEARDYSLASMIKDLIAVMDNLTRALEHKPANLDEKLNNVYAGVEMTKHALESVFKKYNVEILNPQVGEKFDYNIHEAVAQIATDDYNPDCIVSSMQSGYKIKDRLLRPAMVTVSKKS